MRPRLIGGNSSGGIYLDDFLRDVGLYSDAAFCVDFSNPSCYSGSGNTINDLGPFGGSIAWERSTYGPTFTANGQRSYFDISAGKALLCTGNRDLAFAHLGSQTTVRMCFIAMWDATNSPSSIAPHIWKLDQSGYTASVGRYVGGDEKYFWSFGAYLSGAPSHIAGGFIERTDQRGVIYYMRNRPDLGVGYVDYRIKHSDSGGNILEAGAVSSPYGASVTPPTISSPTVTLGQPSASSTIAKLYCAALLVGKLPTLDQFNLLWGKLKTRFPNIDA
jgi:hypothetical protein